MSSQSSPHTAGLACWLSDFPLLLDHKHLGAGFTLNLPPAVSAQPSSAQHTGRPAWAEQFQALAKARWGRAQLGPSRLHPLGLGVGLAEEWDSGRGERAFTH